MFTRNLKRASARNVLFKTTMILSLLLFAATGHAQKYVAGTTPSSAPNAFLDVGSGEITGFMPEVARKIADDAGFELEFKVMPFSALIQSLKAGKIDMIFAGMSPSAKRKEVVDFSDPVAGLGHTIFVRDDNKKTYTGPQDFKGEVIGISAGTDYGEYIRRKNFAKKVNFYDGLAQMKSDVRNGRIVLGMSDDSMLRYMERNGDLPGMHVVDDYKQVTPFSIISVAVNKGNTDLLDTLNATIADLEEDGELERLQQKWGESPVP